MPGARSVCAVAMKFSPDMIDEKPTTNTPSAASDTAVLE